MKTTVTQPSLPPLDEFYNSLKQIWESKWLTNGGPFHEQLEIELAKRLGVKYLSLFSNGTLALISAIQALKLTGEVITTPFSFVATTHSLWWNGLTPVFVDIDPITFNLDPKKIESAITSKTTAILPVHVYGKPCNTEEINRIADKHNLKIIYDAAHAFDVKTDNNSILNFGDLSILSFHATKVFNTIEGGAIISHSPEMKKTIDFLKNFGFEDETTVVGPGINAKMNEIQAAYGLLQLKCIDVEISRRKVVHDFYIENLKNVEGITLKEKANNESENYSYFPILVEKSYSITRDELYEKLKRNDILARRYFYPLISQFPPYNDLPSALPENLPISKSISEKVLCLPIFADLSVETVKIICDIIKNTD